MSRKLPTKKFRKFAFLPFNDGNDPQQSYREILDAMLSGAATTEELLKMVSLVGGISPDSDHVMLDDGDYQLILSKVNGYKWNALPNNREAIADFIKYVRTLPEVDAEIVAPK